MTESLRAPFPYFGYKGQVSEEVWRRLGNPPNYVEPFAGSLAVLLQRPNGPGKREVVNDASGGLVNFWRAVRRAPAQVADAAMWVRSESDLHARNAAIREILPDLTARLEGDPHFFDAEVAGWWCYVQCLAIGEAAYAPGPNVRQDGKLVRVPRANGIRRTVPCNHPRGLLGIQKSIPFHGKQGLLRLRSSEAIACLESLAERLEDVWILAGDWSRACKPTYTTQHGLTGVFFDPPYGDGDITYAHHDRGILDDLTAWCVEAGQDERMRIALCAYEGTLPVDLVDHGWSEHEWKARGGRITSGGQSDANRDRERIYFSPFCLDSVGRSEQLLLTGGGSE